MKKFLFALFSYFALLHTNLSASGITVVSPTDNLPDINSAENPGDSVASFIVSMIGFVAILSIIAITVAAIMMIASVGQQDRFKKARGIAVYAIIGFAISAGAYLIVRIITNLDLSTSFIIF